MMLLHCIVRTFLQYQLPRLSVQALATRSIQRASNTYQSIGKVRIMSSKSATENDTLNEVVDLAKLRQDYSSITIDESTLDSDPFNVFEKWFNDALEAKAHEPNAMCLATCDPQTCMPSARMVLLKGFDHEGFVWFTNYNSRKGQELETNPNAALCFWWPELERSVRIEGMVSKVSPEESNEYFGKRPPTAMVGAVSSNQSQRIADQVTLQQKFQHLQNEYLNEDGTLKKELPRPSHWGGYRLKPLIVEFWKGRASRIHDRIRYLRPATDDEGWTKERLQP